MLTPDSRGIQGLAGRPEGEVQRCVRHHLHHGEDRGPEEPVQRTGGRAAQTDELRLRPHRPVRHRQAGLQQGIRKYGITSLFPLKFIVQFDFQKQMTTLCK